METVKATFTAHTYADTDGVYLGVTKHAISFAAFFTTDEIRRLKEVLENATR